MSTLTQVEIERAVSSKLAEFCWTPLENEVPLAIKTFQSAVGEMDAHVYLSKGDEYQRTLSGNFLSEGRNGLAICVLGIPVEADATMISSIASEFAASVDEQIADSYAVKLFRMSEASPKM